MSNPAFRTSAYGDRSVLLEWNGAFPSGSLRDLCRALEDLDGSPEAIPAYSSITLVWDAPIDSAARLAVEHVVARTGPATPDDQLARGRTHELPVLYGGENGPDLPEVARHTGLSEASVVALHSAPIYPVLFLGFMPGFPYLGGLDPRLATPRHATPRIRVPAGSVGIAGNQTGVYPLDSPGGWQVIGRTPTVLFDGRLQEPALIRPGDCIRFCPILR